MSSIISESTASSTTTTEAHPGPRVHIYLTDSDSEASEDSSIHILTNEEAAEAAYQRVVAERNRHKRRKVSKQLYKPVWAQVEPDDYVKTYSVITQWKPFPEGRSFVKWNTLVRKVELRNRTVDVYRVDWQEVEDHEFDEYPEFHNQSCRFVDEDGDSRSAEDFLCDLLADQADLDSECDSDNIPEEVESADPYISDLEDPEY